MLKDRLGYACINTALKKKKIQTSRGMRQSRFLQDNDLVYTSELALKNVIDLREIVKWNRENGIRFFRITSNLFPWWSEYELEDLPDFKTIRAVLEDIGTIAKVNNQRLTFHPGHFTILASNNPKVVELAIKELEQHSKVFDLMKLNPSRWNKINIHIGTAQGGLESTAERWIKNWNRLSDNCKARITLENDDKAKMWSTKNLYDLIYKQTGVPIVFDLHHHRVGAKSDMDELEALKLALSTWGKVDPIVHISSSKLLFEDSTSKNVAHADFIYETLTPFYIQKNMWFMLEAKAKEGALLRYRENF